MRGYWPVWGAGDLNAERNPDSVLIFLVIGG